MFALISLYLYPDCCHILLSLSNLEVMKCFLHSYVLLLILRLQCIEFLYNHVIEENILLNITWIRITKEKQKQNEIEYLESLNSGQRNVRYKYQVNRKVSNMKFEF